MKQIDQIAYKLCILSSKLTLLQNYVPLMNVQSQDKGIQNGIRKNSLGSFDKYKENWKVCKILECLDYLKIETIKQMIFEDIFKNFEDYDYFVVFTVALKWDHQKLKRKCNDEAIKYGFEQLNFNRYDLLLCQKQIFQQAIKLHTQLKAQQKIKGLRDIDISRIIKQYSINHSLNLNVQELIGIKKENVYKHVKKIQKQNSIQNQNNFIPTPQEYAKVKNCKQKKGLSKDFSQILDYVESVTSISLESSTDLLHKNPSKMPKNIQLLSL